MLLNLVSDAWQYVVNKKRLIIEYVLIGVVLTLAGAALTLWLQQRALEDKLKETNKLVTSLEIANQTQDATIDDLKVLRNKDAQALDGLLNDYKSLASNDAVVRSRLSTLEKSNATVHDYLSQPLPAELTCLLNNTCSKDSNKDRTSSPTAKPNTGL
jgi:uncharacterized membrane-anchored protein YhcB (DUF1043 family)